LGTVAGARLPHSVGAHAQLQTASGIRVAGTEEVDAPEVAISPPPFVVLLAEARDETQVRYTDTGEWLREDARDKRDVNLLLPVVRGLAKLDELALVTYEDLVR
jgi:hypothetical protein